MRCKGGAWQTHHISLTYKWTTRLSLSFSTLQAYTHTHSLSLLLSLFLSLSLSFSVDLLVMTPTKTKEQVQHSVTKISASHLFFELTNSQWFPTLKSSKRIYEEHP